jgi:hypothetical protein
MLGTEVVMVIGGNEDALGISVTKDGDGLRGCEVCGVRVLFGACIDTLRVAEPRTDQVEVVDAVIEDFKSLRVGQKGPEMPRRVGARLNFDVVDFTKEAAVGQRGDGEIVGE